MLPLLEDRWGRRLLFAALYFSEGAPIGFVWIALPTHLAAAGIGVDEITRLTSALVIPWALKFVWAPLIDVLQGPGWTLRCWIIASQSAMLATLLSLAWLDPVDDAAWLLPLLLGHAFCAATQDVAIDALCIRTTGARERGSINGWMQLGMLVGRAGLGGGAILLASAWGWSVAVGCLIAAVALPLLLIALTAEPRVSSSHSDPQRSPATRGGWARFAGALGAVLLLPVTWLGLVFALLAGAAFEGIGAVLGPYLIARDFTKEQVGWFQFVPVIVAMTSGAMLGGYFADRWGKVPTTAIALACIVVLAIALAWWDSMFPASSQSAILGIIIALYVGVGWFVAASYAMFMDLTAPRLAATQFSAFLGATNACEAWSARAAGSAANHAGYPFAFLLLAGVSATMLPWLLLLAVTARRGRRAAATRSDCSPTAS